MRFPTSIIATTLCLMSMVSAHNLQLRAHSHECFYEELHKGDTMTITFQVGDREFGGSGNLEIDFWILDPARNYHTHQSSVASGDHSFKAESDGKHEYCFSNEHWGSQTKEVSFNVHGIVYISQAEAEAQGKDYPLEKEVRNLSEMLDQVKDEQSYIVMRERVHRNTAESTNARVKWWSIFQLGVLIGEGVFQVWWLKRFFEVKRVV